MSKTSNQSPLDINARNIFLCMACTMLLAASCTKPQEHKPHQPMFTLMDTAQTGISFENTLTFNNDFNIYRYRNYYNGGGVGMGDINNDGLIDLYFTGNMVPNKLFLNKGNFKFEDITAQAGVGGERAWSTGVSMADVNGDGWLDIYVCNSGDIKGSNKQNELFINNGDLTFTDQAAAWKVDDAGFSTHAVFFDYDRDGDLDLYILNNSYQAIGSFNLMKNERDKRNVLGGDKLMRNDGQYFTDVSESAGIYGSVIGFGLGITVGDVNDDGWMDMYVSNDFFERDYLYINNQDGTFKEKLVDGIRSVSAASMGADLADINNDARPDLFVTEMLPKENHRVKTVTTFEDWNRYQYNLKNNYYHQFTRNMLQINNGDGTFSEVSRLAGVEASDWSWGALIFDMDNDGNKDLFIANGIHQDLTNQDFLQFASNEEFAKTVISKDSVNFKKLTEIIPSNPIANYAFRNTGHLIFADSSVQWGLAQPGFSNGSAYGDLDNDGDLDLVVNNVNMPSFVYRNETRETNSQYHYLKINLIGSGKNTSAIGAKIWAEGSDIKLYVEQMPMRGFQSSVDHRPNLGLGLINKLSKLKVLWPDGRVTQLDSVDVDKILTLKQNEASTPELPSMPAKQDQVFMKVDSRNDIDFKHAENEFVDFDRDPLIYHMISTEGPRMSKGDVNGDGLDDFFIGGAKDQAGALYVQHANGKFKRTNQSLFEKDKLSEDTGSVFFDADGDGDMDLYVCSGGNEFSASSPALVDRLYYNDGTGVMVKSPQVLPGGRFASTSTVKAGDFDGDGDMDLFVGARLQAFLYGAPMSGYLLRNDGAGKFTDATGEVAPELINIGMITDAAWADVNGDKKLDLMVVGEYMPVTLFLNDGRKLENVTARVGLGNSSGWWNSIEAVDLDGDGDLDFVAGNHGLNSRFRASLEKPVSMYVGDFDENGNVDQIICTYNGSVAYPMVLKHDLVNRIPYLKKKYLKYESYKDQKITDIFSEEQLKKALRLDAHWLATSILINDGSGNFRIVALPVEAQFSPVYGIEAGDFNKDGNTDIVLGGNLYRVKPEVGRYDASFGLLLVGDGAGGFLPVESQRSGIFIDGEVRDIITLNTGNGHLILVSKNNDFPEMYKMAK